MSLHALCIVINITWYRNIIVSYHEVPQHLISYITTIAISCYSTRTVYRRLYTHDIEVLSRDGECLQSVTSRARRIHVAVIKQTRSTTR